MPLLRPILDEFPPCSAYTYMADFEDSNSPTWLNNLDGQVNMNAAIYRKIDFKQSNGKEYKLKPLGQTATLIVR